MPQYKRVKETPEFTIHFSVHKKQVPIFFVELQACNYFGTIRGWSMADNQMRERFREYLFPANPMPKLIGISCFRTQFCVYTLTTETRALEPSLIFRETRFINDVAPKDRWAFDFLTQEGGTKLREVVAEIKAMAADSIL